MLKAASKEWKPNPDATDLRLAYFRKAPGLTLALNGDPEPVRVYRDECQGDPSIRDRCPDGAATNTGVAEPQHLTELAVPLSSRRRSIPASIFSNWVWWP
jgi:NAD-dependent dihydropyrimidine dehydrogenase PreA subunit